MSTETIRLIRDGDKRMRRWVKREIIYLSLHGHHQNDSSFKRGCIKMDSDESHFNVSLIVRTKSQDRVHRPQLLKRKEGRSSTRLTARPNLSLIHI